MEQSTSTLSSSSTSSGAGTLALGKLLYYVEGGIERLTA